MTTLLQIAKKEFTAFFSSPIAFIFLGVFLAVTLFAVFWVETFFARNIADVRPLFEWMPILLIFLTSAITMRMWAEEHRAGTLEFLMTTPVKPTLLVLGKFLACFGLILVAIILTLTLPATVSLIGQLDWGPVIGGYIATLFLAAAYISIGLFVSVKADNQIVSLILSTLVCSLLYLIGSDTIVAFLGHRPAEILALFGTGSRFESITRGVIDFRDLYYYLSIVGVFLSLNILGLEKMRWAGNPTKPSHRRWQLATGLLIANFIIANFWLNAVTGLRLDITQNKSYSISETTRSYLQQVKEPLLIRGYFSPQTHPLLAPLVPRLRDLLEEYAIAGGPNVRVEFVDPLENPELEQEAGQKYGIRPIPFQTSSKYQASVTNSYFDILIQYGDQFETLGFRDLIEVKSPNEQTLDVELRNPEYDITRAIKKVFYTYQGGGDIFSSIQKPVHFTGYLSPDEKLPEELTQLKADLFLLLEEMKAQGGPNFTSEILVPEAGSGEVAQRISTEYGFRPMSASLFDSNTFWFYMTLESGDQVLEIPLPENLDKDGLQRSLDAGLKRFVTDINKTVAVSSPATMPPMPQYNLPPQGPQFNILRDVLSQDHVVIEADLSSGQLPTETDLLVVLAPDDIDDKELFAIDQFLMRGGTVIISSSPHSINLEGALTLSPATSGIEEWLTHHGVSIGKELVLDKQNSPFPIPMERNIGGLTIQETHLVKYPFFIDIRTNGMNGESGLLSSINQMTMNWASPIRVEDETNNKRKVTSLLTSSPESWLTTDTSIQPNFKAYGELGFEIGEEMGSQVLGVVIEGSFSSFFEGKPSPLSMAGEQEDQNEEPETAESEKEEAKQVVLRQIDKSPPSSRIILFSSNSFLSDAILSISSSVRRTGALEPVQMIANAVDWSLEDRGLLTLRGRSHFSRPLIPMTRDQQLFWEYLNYGLMLAGLILVWFIKSLFNQKTRQRQLAILQESVGRI